MADPKVAIALTLVHEGGYVDNKNDPGGITNMGITQADLPGQNMRALTAEQATQYYLQNFWETLYSQIENQAVASKLFDLGVLFGVRTAIESLQTALGITVDGSFGQETLTAVNSAEPINLLLQYKVAFVHRALVIGSEKPSERVFVAGWIKRINS
jgi:type VI secretion system secreted protein VgrG